MCNKFCLQKFSCFCVDSHSALGSIEAWIGFKVERNKKYLGEKNTKRIILWVSKNFAFVAAKFQHEKLYFFEISRIDIDLNWSEITKVFVILCNRKIKQFCWKRHCHIKNHLGKTFKWNKEVKILISNWVDNCDWFNLKKN